MTKRDLETLSTWYKPLKEFLLRFGTIEEEFSHQKGKKELYFPEKSGLKIIIKSDKRSKKSKRLARLFVAWLFEMLEKDNKWDNSWIY